MFNGQGDPFDRPTMTSCEAGCEVYFREVPRHRQRKTLKGIYIEFIARLPVRDSGPGICQSVDGDCEIGTNSLGPFCRVASLADCLTSAASMSDKCADRCKLTRNEQLSELIEAVLDAPSVPLCVL